MENGKMPFSAPVSRNRVISNFPKWYTPQACLQTKDHWHVRVKTACRERSPWNLGMKMAKVVVVGDLYVGKTCLINSDHVLLRVALSLSLIPPAQVCKDLFDRDYKATIGVDFEIERFELLGFPFSLQIWDTAGQEKFKCIASTYYRGAQDTPVSAVSFSLAVIIMVFDLADIHTLEHTRQWLVEAMKENDPRSCSVFLIGTKKDLLAPAECQRVERDATNMATELRAEFWSVSSKTGENVRECFFRVAALAFEDSMLQALQGSHAFSHRVQ
ncbi:hypothetical protein GJAV_G00048030 [Gymnothorax javanicus]|nr:hypothetical protein GJAV_G00048030 [Gymnothorax javanicus]